MNIDLWVARDATDVSVAGRVPVAVDADSEAPGNKKPGDMSAAELVSTLGTRTINASAKTQSAELLVITEDANLTAECASLLGTMFKAIELDRSTWVHAAFLQADNSTTIQLACETIQPKAVVLMLQTGGNTDALAQLRKTQHQVVGVQPFVMVTFHPQDLLDNPDVKRPAWEDLKQLRQWLG